MYKRDGSPYWYFKIKGVPHSSGTEDWDAAQRVEAQVRLQKWEQDRFGVKPPRGWPECVAEWAKRKNTKASWKTDQSRLRWWDQYLSSFADVRLITRSYIDRVMRQERGVTASKASSGNATANRYIAVVSGVLNFTCHELEWIEAVPRLPHYPELDGREEWLTLDQWARLREVLPPHLLGPATFALATGLRQAKVMGLRWEQIDLKGRWMRFTGTANKRGNVIPLNDTAMGVLLTAKGAPVVHATHVWLYHGQPFVKPKVGWYNALKAAGLGAHTDEGWQGLTWHGLRHTFNSWLGQRGVAETIRSRLCGWSGGRGGRDSIPERYTHYDLDHLRPYAAIIDDLLVSIQSQPENRKGEKSA